MATFPPLAPSAAPITPGAWPVSAINSLNGAESRVRQGSAQIGRRLRLTFSNVTEVNFLAILAHYQGQRSGFDPFGFDTTTLAADLTPSGHAWLYASRPQVVDEHLDVFTVVCEFKSEPRGLVVAVGDRWRTGATTLTAGAGSDGAPVATGRQMATASTTLAVGTRFSGIGSFGVLWATSVTTLIPNGVPQTWATGAASVAYSNGNATLAATETSEKTVRSFAPKSSGKWYAELSASLLATGSINSVADTWWGVAANTSAYPGNTGSGGIGITGSRAPLQDALGATLPTSTLGYVSGAARILMIAVDFDAKKLWFGADGTWLASGNPSAGSGASASGWTSTPTWYITFRPYFNGDAATLRALRTYTPAGFSHWGDS
jgi:hypothetical protein